jgi:hypothetical protein
MEGRAADVRTMIDEAQDFSLPDCPTCTPVGNFWPVYLMDVAFFNPGFDSAASVAADKLAPYAARQRAELETDGFESLCNYQLWLLDRRDDVDGTLDLLAAAKRLDRDSYPECLSLAALLEARENPGGPAPMLDRLDSALVATTDVRVGVENLLVAKLRYERDELERALTAVRRRPPGVFNVGGPAYYLPESLYLEGHLAAVLGDTTGAIRAYRHYLKLRTNPDAGPLSDQRDTVRKRLVTLLDPRAG